MMIQFSIQIIGLLLVYYKIKVIDKEIIGIMAYALNITGFFRIFLDYP